MDKVQVFSQLNPPSPVHEVCDPRDLGVLDKVTITKVTDFMQRYQEDASFTPPTVDVLFDTEKFDVSVDDDADPMYMDIEDMDEDIQRAREEFK